MIQRHGNEGRVWELLSAHLISDRAAKFMRNDDFDHFVKEREKTIKEHLISVLIL